MFDFFKRYKYKNQALSHLYALLYLYPRGRDQIIKDYPGILDAIKAHFAEDVSPQRAALLAAAAILADLVTASLSDDQRTLIAGQLEQIEMREMKLLLSDVMAGRSVPPKIYFGTLLFGNAIMIANTLVEDGEVARSDFDMFASEVFGALHGKSLQERSSERINAALDEIIPLPELRNTDDHGPLLPRPPGPSDMPPLSGTEVKVKLVRTPTGIALVREDTGQQITERRTLSQDVLQQVPLGLGMYRFVNLRARTGEIYSCIIAGDDAQIFGNSRAFWWSLAAAHVRMVDVNARMTRMTSTALANIHSAARTMWDTAIREAHSIDNMRDLIMPLRNVHYEVINKLKNERPSEPECMGLDIALAMVLATQSEDAKLEAHAYHCFKRFLWQPGEEPAEFQEYETS